MIKITQRERDNAISAKEMWLTVPERNVSPGLERWRLEEPSVYFTEPPTCNTIACFGGWCAWHPPFVAQGMYATESGAPFIDFEKDEGMLSTSRSMFGIGGMFFKRRNDELTPETKDLSDWQIVMNRIDACIAGTVVQ